MPDLLLYSLDNESLFELEAAAKTAGFRVKTAIDYSSALDWLKLRAFDVLCISAAASLEEQQSLAGLLWKRELDAPFIVYDPEVKNENHLKRARLFGAELALGTNYIEKVSTVLKKAISATELKHRDFKVMVVEDLDSPRDIICLYVEKLGFSSVNGFRCVKDALSALRSGEEPYACIITDIRMPQVTGEELIKEVRADEKLKHLPIIVLTAYGTLDALTDCLKAGASGFLVKPPKKEQLMHELSRAMRIMKNNLDPRLAQPEEAKLIRDLISEAN